MKNSALCVLPSRRISGNAIKDLGVLSRARDVRGSYANLSRRQCQPEIAGVGGGERRAPKAMEGEALAPGVSQEKEMDAPTTSASKGSWIQLGFSSLKSFCT